MECGITPVRVPHSASICVAGLQATQIMLFVNMFRLTGVRDWKLGYSAPM
jgi:hypothetical protein